MIIYKTQEFALIPIYQRFYHFIDWVAEYPHVRESLVKTGWVSWENKWRKEIFKIK